MISPVFEQIANEHADKQGVEFYKFNTDDIPELAGELGIRSVRILLFYYHLSGYESFLDTHLPCIQGRRENRHDCWRQSRRVDGMSCVRCCIAFIDVIHFS